MPESPLERLAKGWGSSDPNLLPSTPQVGISTNTSPSWLQGAMGYLEEKAKDPFQLMLQGITSLMGRGGDLTGVGMPAMVEIPNGASSLVKAKEIINPKALELEEMIRNLAGVSHGIRKTAKSGELSVANIISPFNHNWNSFEAYVRDTYKPEAVEEMLKNSAVKQEWRDWAAKLEGYAPSFSLPSPLRTAMRKSQANLPPTIPSGEVPAFYSNLHEAFSNPKIPNKLSPDQALAVVEKSPGVKKEEVKWILGEDPKKFFSTKAKWTKEEILQHIRDNEVDVVEVPSKFDPATVKNLTMPSRNTEPIFYAWLDQNYTPAHVTEHDIYGRSYFPTRELALRGEQEDAGRYLGQGDPADINTTWISKYRQNYQVQGSNLIDLYNESLGGKGVPVAPIQNVGSFDPQWGPSSQRYSGQLTLPNPQNYRERLLVWGNKPPQQGWMDWLKSNGYDFHDTDGYTNTYIDSIGRIIPEAELNMKYNETAGRSFQSSHFDQPNILAHIRTTDRITPDGKKILFIEEVQSDWQKALRGRDKDLADPTSKWDYKASKILHDKGLVEHAPLSAEEMRAAEQGKKDLGTVELHRLNSVPEAPLARNYPELTMKRILRLASEEGYDGVGWTTGKQQADRYNSLFLDNVKSLDYDLANQKLTIHLPDGSTRTQLAGPKQLPNYVGEEAAEKLLQKSQLSTKYKIYDWNNKAYSSPQNNFDTLEEAKNWLQYMKDKGFIESDEYKVLPIKTSNSSLDVSSLLVGERGYADVYDKQLRNVADKLGKEFGSRSMPGQIQVGNNVGRTLRETVNILSQDPTVPRRIKNVLTELHDAIKDGGSVSEGFRYLKEHRLLSPTDIEDTRALLTKQRELPSYKDAHIFPLTPTLKARATTKGFPLFQVAPPFLLGASALQQWEKAKRQREVKIQ